ncbi:MAG: hypothetical protein ABIJ18_05925 [archaeon]
MFLVGRKALSPFYALSIVVTCRYAPDRVGVSVERRFVEGCR